MEQLLIHLAGDYLTQTDWMANNKTKKFWIALIHAFIYSVPFLLFLKVSWSVFAVICISHALIDHYRAARYWIFFKNFITDNKLVWDDCKAMGYPSSVPIFIQFLLMIAADNTIHLLINYLAIRWL